MPKFSLRIQFVNTFFIYILLYFSINFPFAFNDCKGEIFAFCEFFWKEKTFYQK